MKRINPFHFKSVKKLMSMSINQGKIFWLPKVAAFLPKNWTDNQGNNLYHFAARHQNAYLFELAQHNEAKINERNKDGQAPLHLFIKSSFTVKTEDKHKEHPPISLEYNEALLLQLLQAGADVNQWVDNPERQGQWGKGVVTNSADNHMGSAIETLTADFWKYILTIDFNNQEIYDKYEQFFFTLVNHGANINLIIDSGTFFDLSNESQLDATQFTGRVIVSHFFVKYLSKDSDLYEIRPYFKCPQLDFFLRDSSDNTVLHYLFSRISTRFNVLKYEHVEKMIQEIIENPAFSPEALLQKNSFSVTPLMCFKEKSRIYAEIFEKVILANTLTDKLKGSEEPVKIKRRKI